MATISERYNREGQLIGWQVKVRKRGYPMLVKTFDRKADAQAWATVTESEMVRAVYVDRTKAERTTFKDAIDSYIAEVAPTHKGSRDEIHRLQKLIRDEPKLVAHALATLTTRLFEEYRDRRLREVKPGTVKRELGLLHAVIETVRKSHGMVENPVSDVRRPTVTDARDVRLHGDDEQRILAVIDKDSRNPWLKPAVILAIETAMRRSELLALRWEHVDFDGLSLGVADSKTDGKRSDRSKGRNVPMSPRTYELLWQLGTAERPIDGRVIGTTAEGLKQAFERARTRANMEHLNFHDLRHEATSRLVEKGWGILEVAAVTGHQDLQMLKRYTNLRASDLARKLE